MGMGMAWRGAATRRELHQTRIRLAFSSPPAARSERAVLQPDRAASALPNSKLTVAAEREQSGRDAAAQQTLAGRRKVDYGALGKAVVYVNPAVHPAAVASLSSRVWS